VFRPLPDRRAAADFSILFLNLWGSSPREQRSNVVLEASEGDQIGIRLYELACVVLSGCRVVRTNNLLKKLCTSSVFDGPPMFMKTIAVPWPSAPVFCATGATVALLLLHCEL
jgi:hypothetical protein